MEKEVKDLLNMDLQFFAKDDENSNEGEDGSISNEGSEGDDPTGNEHDKTVSVEEMKRRVAKEQEKYEEKIKEMSQSIDERIEQAQEKAKKEATLTGKELQEYKEKEAQRKLDSAQEEIERLKKENIKRDLKDEAINTLSEKKLPVNERVLSFVVKDTADDTLEAIDNLAELFKEQKEEYAQTEPPLGSGGLGNSDTEQRSSKKILDEAKITDF